MEIRQALTPAQADVLRLLGSGKSYKEIALAWKVRRNTVWVHARMARDAIGARTIFQAVALYAIEQSDNIQPLSDRVN
jgi:DNA-binding CsgD family transcriptional regulator